MHTPEFIEPLTQLGAKACHIGRMRRAWLQGGVLDQGTRHQASEHFLPLAVREAVPELSARLERVARVVEQHPAEDSAIRLLVELADQQQVESVLLPRGGICISSQVGCAVGCQFCMTGKSGLIRQLSSLEMVAQVALGRRIQPVKKVVFMGMGEPAHNLENVLEAIDILGTDGGIGHRNLVFSTVGDPRVFQRLPEQTVRPALALSLHTTRNDLREQLLPRAPRIAPEELVEQAEIYAQLIDYPVQYQWTLLEGINDSAEEMEAVAALLKGKKAVLNLIPYNRMEGDIYQRPPAEQTQQWMRFLHQKGVLTKIRQSAGQEIDGGCGQLRARQADKALQQRTEKLIARQA